MQRRDTLFFGTLLLLSAIILLFGADRLLELIAPARYPVAGFLLLFLLSGVGLGAYALFHLRHHRLFLFQKIFVNANDAIAILDETGRYIWQNHSHDQLTGYEARELTGKSAMLLLDRLERPLKEELDRIGEFSGLFKCQTSQGPREVFISAFRIVDDLDDTVCYVESIRPAAEFIHLLEKTRQEKAQIERLVNHDPLTGLLNRSGFFQQIHERLLLQPWRGCIVFADIDHFKSINDTHGHEKGDQVLIATARQIRENIRHDDLLARFGGEEFVGWLDAEPARAFEICEKVRQRLAATPIEGVRVTCSMGLATMGVAGCVTLEETIRQADMAMYRAKQGGRNRTMVANHTTVAERV